VNAFLLEERQAGIAQMAEQEGVDIDYVWDRENALFVNAVAQRGDEFYMVTDPSAWNDTMFESKNDSAYLYLELPMLGNYEKINIFEMYR
jgi:hypothetical protein